MAGIEAGHAVALEDARFKLQLAERRNQALFDNARDAIFFLTPDGVIRDMNRSGEGLLGMRKHAGKSPAMRYFSMHTFDDDGDARRAATAALLRMLGDGVIRPAIHDRIPLAQAARAQALLESGKVLGKLVLKP